MKKIYLLPLLVFLSLVFVAPLHAQRGLIKRQIKNKVREDMKEKHAEPQREKGRKALEDITYENDTRYPVPNNPVKATLALEMKTFKKNGKLKETTTTKMVFGDTGECLINNEGSKDESRMLFDYKAAALYMLNTQDKIATKMPMINFQKMAEKLAGDQLYIEDENGKWERTNEVKQIHGKSCIKYIYFNSKEKTKMHAWVTKDISIDLSGNHLFGGQIQDFSSGTSATTTRKIDENFPEGLMVRSVHFEKNNDTPSVQMDLITVDKTSDPKYFDLSGYEIHDVLSKL